MFLRFPEVIRIILLKFLFIKLITHKVLLHICLGTLFIACLDRLKYGAVIRDYFDILYRMKAQHPDPVKMSHHGMHHIVYILLAAHNKEIPVEFIIKLHYPRRHAVIKIILLQAHILFQLFHLFKLYLIAQFLNYRIFQCPAKEGCFFHRLKRYTRNITPALRKHFNKL